ncbi:MAG: hypothetical protein H7Y43_16325 [Akkermansiaceae bacterium]|nr:hypothetical protein [Verrucomicrobiales bacterium]
MALHSVLAADQFRTNEPMRQIDFAVRAKKIFLNARVRFQSETNHPEAAWQFARACFDLGEFAPNDSDRAEVAEMGIAVAKPLVTRQPRLAEAHYYLAMNLGQLARTKSLGALRLVDQMETEFLAAAKLNEKLDHAGPDRNLGTLYLEAPSFGSIGSRSKARQHLRRAVQIAPDYPENRLILTEAYSRWNEQTLAAREFKLLTEGWDLARQKFTGEEWGSNWIDWEKRFQKLKTKFGDASKPGERSKY